jgi:hypothetical protein
MKKNLLKKFSAYIIPIAIGNTMLFFVTVSSGQIQNGSFENGSNPDLSFWEGSCSDTQSYNNAPPGGGNWSLQISSWSFPHVNCGKAFQKLPTITNGQTFILSGWAYSVMSPPNGTPTIGLYFGKINNGIITLQSGDTTSSASWTSLSVQSSFSLSTGDTAVVVLYGGNVPQVATGYGYFDLINLQQVTGINENYLASSIHLFPNPASNHLTIALGSNNKKVEVTITDITGKIIYNTTSIDTPNIEVNTQDFANGIYVVQIQSADFIGTKKLVIQK